MKFYLVKDFEEVVKWHVVFFRQHTTIAATMAAVEVASQSAFPEKLVQFVFLRPLLEVHAVELKPYSFVKAESVIFSLNHPLPNECLFR